MFSGDGVFKLAKRMALLIVVVSVGLPLRYGSTNPSYVFIRLLHSLLSLKHSLVADRARPTLSADYRAFEDILRMRPSAELDPFLDPLTLIKQLRLTLTMSNLFPKSSRCRIDRHEFEHGGHQIDLYTIDDHPVHHSSVSDRILLYLHGGAYMVGDIHSYSGLECHLSRLFNVSVLHLEYRLSPEHPLPAAVDDTVALYRSLLRKNISPSRLILMGDSAGGGLSLLTVQALVALDLPVPRGVIALSPWTDLSGSGESYTRNRLTDVLLSPDKSEWLVKQILVPQHSQFSSDNPRLSPLFGSFQGFPPMFINVGTAELLEDDSRSVVEKAQQAGVNVTFEEGKHMMHVYPIFFPYYPEARKTLTNIHRWIQTMFNHT